MMRLNFILLLAVLASAMYLVRVQYESRQLFTELEKAKALGYKLEIEQNRLQAERRAQATSLRVESLARERLSMRIAMPAITQYVRADGSPVAVEPGPAKAVLASTSPVRGKRP